MAAMRPMLAALSQAVDQHSALVDPLVERIKLKTFTWKSNGQNTTMSHRLIAVDR